MKFDHVILGVHIMDRLTQVAEVAAAADGVWQQHQNAVGAA